VLDREIDLNLDLELDLEIHPIELITEQAIKEALFSQSTKKAPGLDKLNFKAIRLL
jgi:hypothetical protein